MRIRRRDEKRVRLPGTDVGDDEAADDEKHIHAADPESKREVKPRTRGDVEVHHEKRGDHTQKMHVVNHEFATMSLSWCGSMRTIGLAAACSMMAASVEAMN